MAGNEVNDIVVRLLAAADKIGGREREEIMHHVGRLSRAATRERTVAVEEMQKLRKKVVQQSTELKKFQNTINNGPAFPVSQGSLAPQPPLAGGYGRYDESRLQALPRPPTSTLDYGAGYGRLSRPEGLAQPMRRATSMENATPMLNGEQQNATASVPVAQASSHPVQDQPGYGLFNPARFLALQSDPPTSASSNSVNDRSSLFDGPPAPTYAVTAANAEPVAPRDEKRGTESANGDVFTKQAADQLLDEINKVQTKRASQKRRASESDVPTASTAKRQAIEAAVPLPGAHFNTLTPNSMAAIHSSDNHVVKHGQQESFEGCGSGYAPREVQDNRVFSPSPPHPSTLTYVYPRLPPPNSPVRLGYPHCTNCFKYSIQCDGEAHCAQGHSHKCYYVLCDPKTCQGTDCVKIHSFQYDLAARKSGEVRRLVLGDNLQIATMGVSRGEQFALRNLVSQMGQKKKPTSAARTSARGSAARNPSMEEAPLAGLPLPAHATRQNAQAAGKDSDSEDSHPFRVPKAVRNATSWSTFPLASEPARPGSLANSRSIKFERSDY